MSRTIEVELVASVTIDSPLAGAIVVATDGTHDSDGAVRVGVALGRRDGVNAALISVVEPISLFDDEGSSPEEADRLTRIAIESRDGELAAQRKRTSPGTRTWPFAIHVGNRVDEIVKYSEHCDASLIVLGLGSHGVIARLLHRETALRVIRSATTPVLAVPHDASGLPRSALAAIDFTPASEHAASAALRLLGGRGTLYLAHVTPRVTTPQGDSRPWGEPGPGVLTRLEAAARRLDAPAGVQIEFASLHGDPAHELLAFAEQYPIDMIATGAHGRTSIGRLALGSVSTKMIRSAHCWVLVAPTEKLAESHRVQSFEPNAQPIG